MKIVKILALSALLALSLGSASAATHDIYPDPAQAPADLAAALKTAAASHKRILLDFGGNWCGDCQVLDLYFHDARNLRLLQANFVLVHVNIGNLDANQEIARKYDTPLDRGVPAVAVLSEKGTLLFSQKTGQFSPMRSMESSVVTEFLMQWKPAKAGCSTVMLNC